MDARLRYTEFCDAFLPLDPIHASMLVKKESDHMFDLSSIPAEKLFREETMQSFA